MGKPHPDWELGRRGGVRCSYRMPSLECGIVADVLFGDQLYISANHISKERDGNDVKESGGLAECQAWNAELRLKQGGDKKKFCRLTEESNLATLQQILSLHFSLPLANLNFSLLMNSNFSKISVGAVYERPPHAGLVLVYEEK